MQLILLVQDLADVGNFRHIAYRDNLFLELSLAGSWTGELSYFSVTQLHSTVAVHTVHTVLAFVTDSVSSCYLGPPSP